MSVFELAELVQRIGEIRGRKRLQKIVYLLQQLGFPFFEEFEYGHYGPFSRSLEAEMDLLVRHRLVQERKRGSEYMYVAGKELKNFLSQAPVSARLKTADFAQALQLLSSLQTPVLELASTRLFLLRAGYDDDAAHVELGTRKPHLQCYLARAKQLLANLRLAQAS